MSPSESRKSNKAALRRMKSSGIQYCEVLGSPCDEHCPAVAALLGKRLPISDAPAELPLRECDQAADCVCNIIARE